MVRFAVFLGITILALAAVPATAALVDTAFTYQGKLTDLAGVPLTGTYDMTFKLYDSYTGGTQVGLTDVSPGIVVTNGLFTTVVDFGISSFITGYALYMQTTVNGTVLSPRIAITPVPVAINAMNALSVPWSGITGAPASLPPSGTAGGDLTGTYPNPTVGAGKIDSTKIVDGTVALADMATGSVDSTKIVDASVALADLAGNSVNSSKIVDGSIGLGDMSSNSVDSTKIVDGTVALADMATGSVDSTKIVDASVALADLAGNSVNSSKIVDASIGLGDMSTGSVDAAKIVDGAVASGDLASDAASLAKVSGGAAAVSSSNVGIGTTTPAAKLDVVGTAKMTGFQLGTVATAGQVLTTSATGIGTWQALPTIPTSLPPSGPAAGDLAGTYPNPTIATSAVTSTKIADGTIALADLAASSVDASKVVDGTIASADLASDAASLAKVSGGAAAVSSSNVGIGTTTPAAKLDVIGTAKMTGFQLGAVATAGQVLTTNATGVGTWQTLPTSLPPSGTAGGDLTGTYPNPTVGTGTIDSTNILDGSVASIDLASDAASLAKVSGGAVTVSSGKIGIGTSTPGSKLDVAGVVRVDNIDIRGATSLSAPFEVTSGRWTLDQEQLVGNSSAHWWATQWQSFTAGATGSLVGLAVSYGANDGVSNWSATLSVYEGEGTGGTLLSTQTVTGDGVVEIREFPLLVPVSVTSGDKYTIAIDSDIDCRWVLGYGDYYPGGICHFGASFDFWFRTYVDSGTSVTALAIRAGTSNVGIGTQSPTATLHVVGNSNLIGNVGVNTTSPAYTLDVNGSARVTGALYCDTLPQGDRRNVQWDTTTHQFYQAVSSRRYKDNITPLVDDFQKFLLAEPRIYTMKGQPDVWEIGYIAEDIDALGLNHLVHYDLEGRPDALKYDKMVIYLNEIVRHQQKQIDDQAKRNADLQRQIDQLGQLIADLERKR